MSFCDEMSDTKGPKKLWSSTQNKDGDEPQHAGPEPSDATDDQLKATIK